MIDSTWNRLNLMMIQQGELSTIERCNILLNSGCDAFNMQIGNLTRIEDDCLSITFSTHKKWQDAQFSLYQTPCQFTVEYGDLIASHNLSDTDWDDYGVIEPLQFGAYISIPIFIENHLYGTLCFASKEPREDAFSSREEAFLRMLATSLRNLIQQS